MSLTGALIAITIAACETTPQAPLSGYEGGEVLRDVARQAGAQLGAKEAAEMDEYLAKPMAMKAAIEKTAGQFKSQYASNPEIMERARLYYSTATEDLANLCEAVKNDFDHKGSRPSQLARLSVDAFESSGNQFCSYYAEVSGEGRFGGGLVLALGLLGQVLETWQSFGEGRTGTLKSAVDERLSPVAWDQIPPNPL